MWTKHRECPDCGHAFKAADADLYICPECGSQGGLLGVRPYPRGQLTNYQNARNSHRAVSMVLVGVVIAFLAFELVVFYVMTGGGH
jgi:tRNA(Ile2) C34 agmatinyltransferase TiaS